MLDNVRDLGVAQSEHGQIVKLGNCLPLMREMDPQSVDVVVTSPPYNLSLAYGVYDDSWDENEYVDWLCEICGAIKAVLKQSGSFFLNISGSNSRPYVPFEVMVRLRGMEFYLQNHIILVKSIGMETSSHGHFKPVGGKRYMHHNHAHIYHLTLNNVVELDRLSIGLPFQGKTNIARRDHERDLRCRGNTWFIPYSTVRSKAQKYNHPGTFPVELPLWCIYLHGIADSVVLDPFVGTGTTLVAARMAGARGVGIDMDPAYVETARQRLEQTADGAVDVLLDRGEVQELLKPCLAGETDGGFVVSLQKRTNKTTGHLMLSKADVEQIRRYAFGDGGGGTAGVDIRASFGIAARSARWGGAMADELGVNVVVVGRRER